MAPFLALVFLFFVVGFLTTANTQFQAPLKTAFLEKVGSLQNTMAVLVTFSWFLAYPVCGSTGSAWINRYGYKGTLIRSIFVMIAGLILFFLSSLCTVEFPGAVLRLGNSSVPAGFLIFLAGSFVTGASATIMQVVINPYLTACHIAGTQPVQRLAIGGASNSIGTTIAPYFVTMLVFGSLSASEIEISRLMLPFAALAIIMCAVAASLFKLSMPDIAETKTSSGETLERSVWSFKHLKLGVIAIFFYVGVEVCTGANINLYAAELGHSDPALLATIYWGAMLVGRLIGSSLNRVSPRMQLICTTIATAILVMLSACMNNAWMLAAAGLFHSIMWGAIFTLAVNKLGKYTSAASGVFMIGVVGGAILPLLQGIIADIAGSWRWSWLMIALGEIYMLYYALHGSRIREEAK
jgi:FHS family L-fucose permease-like MFS transporter